MIHLTGPILGHVERDQAWVSGGTVLHEPPTADSSGSISTISGYALPGLVDLHCHVGLGADGATDLATAEADAIADRDTGVLLIREAGNVMDTRWVDQRADLPRIIRAGRHIARPRRYIRGYAVELDDVAQLPEEMARQARAGDGWVKLVADWLDRSMGADAVVAPLWPAEVLKDGIAAAHENGARVTVHAFSHASIGPLLDAGIDCIEHGTGMDADQIAEAARRGIPVTPTLRQVDNFCDFAAAAGARFPAYADQMQGMYEHRHQQVRDFAAAGVQLLPGSDAGGTLGHGTLPAELMRWQEAGIDAADVVDFATWRARKYLGAPALGEGEPADVVVYEDDPRDDVANLTRPKAVLLHGVSVR
ncbi:MAG TPA: amidohydrolase family protein [Actinomycetaceae bacterium]|nr:amidohydrolase family protein [Actinomycetaceae bacterium]